MRTSTLASVAALCAGAALAQPRTYTTADYQRAEKFMTYNTTDLVFRANLRPNWLSDGRVWYSNAQPDGSTEYILADPAKGTRKVAFDHAKLAAALAKTSGTAVDAKRLSLGNLDFSSDGATVEFNASDRRFKCDTQGNSCTSEGNAIESAAGTGGRGGRGGGGGRGGRGAAASGGRAQTTAPDGSRGVFIRDNNLWVHLTASNEEKQLTKDGVKDYGYATDNAGWATSDRAVVVWSPDSKKVATYQQDQRKVGDMYLVNTQVGHPQLRAWKYPLPGDENVTMIEPVIIDTETGSMVRVKLPPQQHRSTLCDDVACRGGEWADVEWAPDGQTLAYVATTRDHKQETLYVINTNTGDAREVMSERVKTQFESGNGAVNWKYLPATHEIIWFSERDNWGHLYLYNSDTGQLKSQITKGDWNVTQVTKVDEKTRTIWFQGVGHERGQDPYFIHSYRINMDGSNLVTLTPDDGNHTVQFSPDYKYLVDTYSKPDMAPAHTLRDANGKLVAKLEAADISKLEATGWKPPQPIVMKARDGVTDIYGLMFKPLNLDPSRKYPIINHIYPGPQTGSVGSRNFSAARGDCQALAELGFVVVEIDGMGTPWRSKSFHDAYYGDMGDNTLPDQVAGMKQLAAKYPWIDIDKAGIYGHSGGGYATADAMFRYPDFFKVGISESGNHDNREYEDDWGERYQGMLEKLSTGGKTNYDGQANQSIAKNLKGHLLLAHGTMDNNVPPYNTLLVVQELIKANKDFDLLLLPNRPHGYGDDANYMTRRRWDYFVRYLAGAEPPKEYEMHPSPTAGRGGQ